MAGGRPLPVLAVGHAVEGPPPNALEVGPRGRQTAGGHVLATALQRVVKLVQGLL